MSPVECISLKLLALKSVAIQALLSAQRVDSLNKLKLGDILISDHAVKIKFTDIIKQSRPNFYLFPITIKAYAPKRRLRIVILFKEYIRRTRTLRHKAISKTQNTLLHILNLTMMLEKTRSPD